MKEIRLFCKISQKTLVERTKLSPSYISRIECSSSELSTKALEKIAHALDVDIATFFSGYSVSEGNDNDYTLNTITAIVRAMPENHRQYVLKQLLLMKEYIEQEAL